MTFKIRTEIKIKYNHGSTGATVHYQVIDESGGLFGAAGTLTESSVYTGLYEGVFTPDVAGFWTVCLLVGTTVYAMVYPVEVGLIVDANTDIETLIARLTAVRAGYLDNLDVAVSSRLAASTYTAERGTDNAMLAANGALEATLTAMKGAGWSNETLKAIKDAITALENLSAAGVWAYATRSLTDKAGFTISGTKTTLDALNDVSQAQVNTQVDGALDTAIPGSPTADSVNERVKTLDDNFTTTIAGRIDAAISTRAPEAGGNVAAIKAKTDIIGASVALETGGKLATIDGHITADYTATEKAAIDLLDDAAGGLADIHTDLGTAITAIGDVHATDLPAAKTVIDDIHADVGTAITAIGDMHATDLPDLHTDVGTAISGQNVPAADSTANTLERDVDGNKTDTAVMVVGTTKSIIAYVKGIITMLTKPAADSTNNVYIADVVGSKDDAAQTTVGTTRSLMGYLKGVLNQLATAISGQNVPAQDATTNTLERDVDGNKLDTAVMAVGTTKSIVAYVKGIITMLTLPAADSTNNVYPADVDGNKTDAAQQTVGTTRSIMAYVKALLTNLTSTRAGYLDRLANNQVNRTFFSDVDDVIDLPASATDTDLPSIVLPNISGTIVSVRIGIKVRMMENTSASGANAINGAQDIRIKKSTGAWGTDDVAAINLADNQWGVAASTREGGDVQVGDNDVASEVDALNATYNLRFENALVDYASLRLNDVQVFAIVTWY